MRVLVIGRDPNLFNPTSEAFLRVKEYAGLFEEYHIISVGTRGKPVSSNGNFHLWPTRPLPLFLSWMDAIRLGQKVIKKHRINLIDAQDAGEAGAVAFLLSKITGIPFRIQVHTDIFSPFYRHISWKEYIRYHLAKFLLPRANCLRVVSQRIKTSIRKSYEVEPHKISVLSIWTDVSKFLEAQPDPTVGERFRDYDFKMIAVGRFVDKEKNFHMLIEMMRDFVKIYPKALLVLVGEGPDEENYKLQITNYKLESNVIIEKWRSDLPSFYKSFDMYLLSSNYEGWGRTVIEAMASGLPVVMTDVGLAGEVVKNNENGIVVPPADKEKFLQSVRDLYENPEKRIRLARAGRKTAQGMVPATKEKYLSLYKENLEKCVPLEIQTHLQQDL